MIVSSQFLKNQSKIKLNHHHTPASLIKNVIDFIDRLYDLDVIIIRKRMNVIVLCIIITYFEYNWIWVIGGLDKLHYGLDVMTCYDIL